ncbi:hypothetical protein WA026_014727 [Henosepilachna vigintioctopunctata]|uniref:Ribosomal protein L9 n=1 Tax=Henosepilachna vigintioctopunctata TaxID=420089 RepID=A0AAW1V9V3_9CUCU
MFLIDGRISGLVVHHLGKIFYKKRKIPVPIKIDPLKIKSSIEAALKKTTFQVHSKGDSSINPKLKDVLFKNNFPIFLQLNVWKIPKCHPQLVQVELEHSILDTHDEVCLIVPDVKEIKKQKI